MEKKVNIIATDNGSLEIEPVFPVEKLDYTEAIKKYKPTIVISSWMPIGEDWTPSFRQASSIKEYILIGETEGGCCASDATWGRRPWDAEDDSKDFIPEYKKDGFKRLDLDYMKGTQICRMDRIGAYYNSRTVSFRRK